MINIRAGLKLSDVCVVTSRLTFRRAHHNELHADLAKFENKYGHQLVVLFLLLDHAIAVGVIGEP
ncbi:hypothetical protein [Rosenbergiella australiborealis]|uniref:DUF968 domain-containing protein n=1 Tax=Rosenbergiella australiborealis TaxID=1544696 RepID=UPI003B8A8E2F